jgi:GT2 family glycosyltransferase
MKKIDIIVLNFNGAGILPKCLPSIVGAAKRSLLPCQVIVLDNGSTDNSLEYVKKTFPQVKIISARENKVLFSYNELLPKLDSDIVILLNNDIKVEPDFISPLISRFSSPSVFAVAPKQLSFSGKTHEGGKNKLEFHFGLMASGPLYGEDPIMDEPGATFYEANSAYDRKKFVELGGFDDIYFPSTWEDADLCYRAWKRGWTMLYEPKSVIYHHESYTITKEINNNNLIFKDRRANNRRNAFIFIWLNITDPAILFAHVLFLPFNLLNSLLYDRAKIVGFFQAVQYLPRILKKRKIIKQTEHLSDRTVFMLAQK